MTSNDAENDANAKKPAEEDRDELEETRLIDGDTAIPGQPDPKSQPEEWVGRRLGRYQISQVLGVGGMGVVLKAHDTSIERDVALKVLPSHFSQNEKSLGRFLLEAKSAGKLNHPHAVTIHEIARDGTTHYLVMELVGGGSASEHLQTRGAFSVPDATRMAIEACRGLSAAHRAGLVHRDVKPANLLLTKDGTVKVSDFGLAKRTEADALEMTQEGQLVGTPYFMSPEQCESRPVDARSDIYSLGATYYSLLTGKNPYEDSGSVVQVMFAHCNASPPDPREVRSHVPPACASIVERSMAAKPEDRYQTADEMRTDLEAVLAAMSGAGISLPSESSDSLPKPKTQTQVAPRRNLIAAVVAGILLTAVAGYLIFKPLSGDGTQSGGQSTVTPATGSPIRVGVLHSLTDTMAASESPVVDATLLAIEEINQNGGLLGRPVEVVVADGKSDSNVFASEAIRLIEDEAVCTVFGCWTSASRKTVVPVFEELDHLLIYPVQYEGVEESPSVIYTGAAPNQQIIPAVKWAFAFENKRKFFLVGSDYVFPRVAHEIIKDQLKELGAQLVGEEFLPLGSEEVQPVVDKIVVAKPDVILNSINGGTNTEFFKQLRAAGILPQAVPTISFSIGEAELEQLDVSTMAGDYAAWNYFQSIDSEENQAFVKSFRAKYGESRVVTDPMEAAYFGVKLWAQAVESAETDDTRSIRRAMRNQRTKAPNGQVRIDPATQHTFKTPRIGRVKSDGQFEIIWTSVNPEPPNPYPSTRTTEQWKALLHDLYTDWGGRWSAASD